MVTRYMAFTPWFEPDYERSYQPAKIIIDFERRHLVRIWQGIPGIECTSDGTLFATWYSGGNTEGMDNYVLLARKRLHKDWETPLMVIESVEGVRCFDECIWIDPLGRLHLFWAQAYMYFDGKEGVWETICDDPQADQLIFSEPRRLCDGVMLNRPTPLKSGRWLYTVARVPLKPGWPFCISRIIGGDPEEDRRNPYVFYSDDQGKTIFLLGEASFKHSDAYEHMLYEKQDGKLRMMVRNRPTIYESISVDGGHTWSPESNSGIPNPCSRFHIRRLPSGRILLVNHDNPEQRNNLCAFLSEDDGATWPYKLLLDERSLVSYPDVCFGPDGEIFIIYDRDRYAELEILLACITEEDILQGSLVSETSFLKQIIDKP